MPDVTPILRQVASVALTAFVFTAVSAATKKGIEFADSILGLDKDKEDSDTKTAAEEEELLT